MEDANKLEWRVRRFLEGEGIYQLGDRLKETLEMPCGYYERRRIYGEFKEWKLPDFKITVFGVTIEVNLKSDNSTIPTYQGKSMKNINYSGGISFVLRPDGFETFKSIILYLKSLGAVTAPYRAAIERLIQNGQGIQYKF